MLRPADLGFGCGDRIYVLHVGAWDRPRPEPKRPLDMVTYAYWLARRTRFKRDLASIPVDIEVIVLPRDRPRCCATTTSSTASRW